MKKIVIISIILSNLAIASEEGDSILDKTYVKVNRGSNISLKATCIDIKKHFKGKEDEEKKNYSWKKGDNQKVVINVETDSKFTTAHARAKISGIASGEDKVSSGDKGNVICSSQCKCEEAECVMEIS